ncbi:MAG: signal peptidase I [Planctomycetales bacterium]|nr:signal peptidase I [Planctomycetales bacterium]
MSASKRKSSPASTTSIEGHEAPGGDQFRAAREMIESIVVAFVLAFLFRTFEAEAFVIPTGSMSPSLLGQHKDIECPHCGYRYMVSASSEASDDILLKKDRLKSGKARMRRPDGSVVVADLPLDVKQRLQDEISDADIVAGMCPMCRFLTPTRSDLPANVLGAVDVDAIVKRPTYPGDRILVNKYGFDFREPERWDVVVFKFPGNGNMNYIKRLVGLPGESLQIYQGDLFTRPLDDKNAKYKILRKPPHKAAAMLQPVHDSHHESASLYQAGWPLRWAATTPNGWSVEATAEEQTVAQRISVDNQSAENIAWLRYRHLVPDSDDWLVVQGMADKSERTAWEASPRRPQLISDFNSYNARLRRQWARQEGWRIATHPFRGSQGTEWVGDLAVECEVEVLAGQGSLTLDVVEAGYHFQAEISLEDGTAELHIVDGRTQQPLEFSATAKTSISGPGDYRLRFANMDDQLMLWVDDELVDFGDASYDPDALFGSRDAMIPWTSDNDGEDQGDLSPVGVGARSAKLEVKRLRVLRDIYYIATKYSGRPEPDNDHGSEHFYDYAPITTSVVLEDGTLLPRLSSQDELFMNPSAWQRFRDRHKRTFPIAKDDQFFVMGDNSPESQDCRIWMSGSQDADHRFNSRPGGAYLNRKLLIGEAVCVFWPHSWGGIPGIPSLPGLPNFGDMRLVR